MCISLVKLVKISFLFLICYWFHILVNKDYQSMFIIPWAWHLHC